MAAARGARPGATRAPARCDDRRSRCAKRARRARLQAAPASRPRPANGDATPESIAYHLAPIPGTSYPCFVSSPAHATSPPPGPAPRSAHAPAVRNTLLIILVLNVLVVAIKIAVGVHTRALSVLGAALESGLDVFNNLLGIVL